MLETGVGGGGGIANVGFFGLTPTLIASNLTLRYNEAVGGTGNSGGALAGDGIGGGIENFNAGISTVSSSAIEDNQAIGGKGLAGANGADGLGGGLANILGSTLTVNNCTVDHNRAIGGEGEDGGNGGNGLGGGVYNDGSTSLGVSSLTVTGSSITHNLAIGGVGDDGSDGQGIGGGVYTLGTFHFDAFTIIRKNHASTSNNDLFP